MVKQNGTDEAKQNEIKRRKQTKMGQMMRRTQRVN